MPKEKLPAYVRHFISQHVSSIEQLDILAFLLSTPEGELTPASVYKVVRSNLVSIERGLEHFANIGLLQRISTAPVAYRSTLTQEMRTLLEDTCRYHKTMPVRVIEAVHAIEWKLR